MNVVANQDSATPIKHAETRIAKMHLRKDGIIHSVGRDDLVESLADAHEQIEAIKSINDGLKRPFLADARKLKKVEKEAREFYASAATGDVCEAVAIMAETRVSKVLINFFMKINKPAYPMRMFTDEEEAIEWLKTFL